MVRLCQDAFNMQSLALYASVGFDVVHPLAYLALTGSGPIDDNFRPATPQDYDAMDALCREVYRISRKGEYVNIAGAGIPIFVLDRGHVAGYFVGTPLGHGVAESIDDMLALIAGMGATMPEAHAFVPLRNGELYRRALAAGHRNQKTMNLMVYGPYEEPAGTWCPSVMF
jgi:hypothetical protein